MGEGGTPLVESARLGPALGMRLYFKLESLNPTGSYKDRIASVGAAVARRLGYPAMIATSSGNAGAAIAAYAARARLKAILVVPEEAPAAKLAQIRAYGATVIGVRGAFAHPDGGSCMFRAVVETAASRGWLPMITAHRYAPAAMEGVKTLALEIIESLGQSPDRVYVPVGGGGLLAATWRGFVEAQTLGWSHATPRIVAVQPEGCSPVVQMHHGLPRSTGVTTTVSGLQVAAPPDADLVLDALRASNGAAVAVSDAEVYAAQRRLAREEAIFTEPAGAAAVAALLAGAARGVIGRGETVVCLITGSGFKDAAQLAIADPIPVLDVEELHRLGEVT
jgi:threonine synthase